MVDEKEYLNVIEIARKTLPKYEVDNLAELELKLFERNSSTKKVIIHRYGIQVLRRLPLSPPKLIFL